MNAEQIAKMDAEFYSAFAKDKTINRAKFNAKYIESMAKNTEKQPKNTTFSGQNAHIFNEYCTKFPNVLTPNLVIWGATGTGKTFAATHIKNALEQKKVWVEFTTAFNMINEFQKYVNSFGRDNERIEDFLNCDVLIIDDLGAEPMIRNVTIEHIYNILNERLKERATIITTNLAPAEALKRYDQRIASRLYAKDTTTILEMTGKDKRL